MASVEATVDVPTEQYADHVPDDYDEETVEIGLTAFGDKLYVKFPRFDRRGTNDFCMGAKSIFRATIRVYDRGELAIEPCLRRMNVLRQQEGEYVHGNPSDVATLTLGDKSDADPAHLKLVEAFTTTIAGFQDDDYWNGYKRAANVHGDERYRWEDVAWDCFEKQWNGDKELLLHVGRWLAREGMVVCSRTNAFFPIPEWTTPTGSYVATISDVYSGKCPNCGADKDEHWECIRSSNRIRVANKYKCQKCGETRTGITTG